MALLEAVRRQGKRMLDEPRREEYLVEKERLLVLLEVADHDAIAGPLLAIEAQIVFDEESRRFRQG